MYRLLKYERGAKIHPHTDHGPFVYGSCTFNLNDDYTGGRFAFFNGAHKVALGKGDAMIFPADYFWVHAVEEITSGTRYSTNSFLQSLPERVLDKVLDFAQTSMNAYRTTPELHDGTFYRIKP
jgi:predicted 2-oxoglutarate/Fe(II)-dependent dioxygenase YbiX